MKMVSAGRKPILRSAARAPGEELGHRERLDFRYALLDHQVVDRDETGRGESQFREHQEDAVKPEGELIPETGQVCPL